MQLSFTSTVTVRGLRGGKPEWEGPDGWGGEGRGRPSGYKAITWWDVGVRLGLGS